MNRYLAFQKVVELGSFTKAAEVLGYTQPAMSQMITSLEKELSIKLLYRYPPGHLGRQPACCGFVRKNGISPRRNRSHPAAGADPGGSDLF